MKHVSTYLMAVLAGGLVLPLSSYASGAEHHRGYKRHQVKIIPSREKSSAMLRHQSGVVHINSSNLNQLIKIKGIGEKKADGILQYRKQHGDFKKIDDLASVKGIGKSRLEKIIKANPGVIAL